MLGKNQCNIKNNQCTGEEESSEYLAACVIKTVQEESTNNDDSLPLDESGFLTTKNAHTTSKGESELALNSLRYLAGWVARKYVNTHLELGTYTNLTTMSDSKQDAWVQNLSYGGLIEPSYEWLQCAIFL